MYEPSRHLATYFIAGFQHWDGALVLDQLKPGTELTLKPEPENPHDPDAMAIQFNNTKLGYIPASETAIVSVMSYYGHTDAFELRVLQVDREAEPWKQLRVGLYVSDAR